MANFVTLRNNYNTCLPIFFKALRKLCKAWQCCLSEKKDEMMPENRDCNYFFKQCTILRQTSRVAVRATYLVIDAADGHVASGVMSTGDRIFPIRQSVPVPGGHDHCRKQERQEPHCWIRTLLTENKSSLIRNSIRKRGKKKKSLT